MDRPGPHPDPPPDLGDVDLPYVAGSRAVSLRRVLRGPWYRLHDADRAPLHFGRLRRYRFDDPARRFGVLYAGADAHCAFIESFGQSFVSGLPARHPIRSLTREALERRRLVRILPRRELRLVDLTGPGLSRLGADGRLCSGNYDVAQRWSRAIWSHPSRPDGLCYRARHDPSRIAVAIYDRAKRRVRAIPMGSLMADPNHRLRDKLLDNYGMGLLP